MRIRTRKEPRHEASAPHRWHLLAIGAAAALPLVVFAAVIAILYSREQQSSLQQTLLQSARAAMTAADRELAADLGVLHALAHIAGNLAAEGNVFSVQTARVLETLPDWLAISIEELAGNRRNALLAASYAAFVPPLLDNDAATRLLGLDQPVIGNLQTTAEGARYLRLSVRVVAADGQPLAISAFLDPVALSNALAGARIPAGWTAAVLDSTHTIVGRNRAPEAFVGVQATASLRYEIETGADRFFYAYNQERDLVYTAIAHSRLSDWTAAVGVPAGIVEAPLERTMLAIVGGGLAALLLAGLLVLVFVRSFASQQETERRLMAMAAENETAHRLAEIAANFPGAIIRRVLHRDGRVSYPFISDGITDILGMPLEEARRANSLIAFAPYVHPEDRATWQKQLMDSARHMQPYRFDARVVGGVRWVRSIGRPRRQADGDVVWDGVLLDVTDIKQAEQHQKLLLQELSHRVKNTLAVVGAIASRTLDSSASLAEFRDAFEGRLQALGRIHSLLTETRWEATQLSAVVDRAVAPHLKPDGGNIRWSGPEAAVDTRAALALTLVLHEMATNALKYGALSGSGGSVEIVWTIDAGRVTLVWSEQDGPPVEPPARRGFGTTLITRSVAYELSGEVQLDFRPDGLRCMLVFPLESDGTAAPKP